MNVGLFITFVVIVIIGIFVYVKFIAPMMSGKALAGIQEAQEEFNQNKEVVLNEYYADDNRFGMFKQIIPDEEIKGIVNFPQPKTVGKAVLGELASGITGVKKVNMDMFYMVITDDNLHIVISNGQNTISHTVLALELMKNVAVSKGGRNIKDQVVGHTGEIDKLTFSYKGEEFSYNIYRMFYGYPKFKVEKNYSGNFDHIYYYDTGKAMSKEFQYDYLIHESLYEGFKKQMESKFHVRFA